MEYSHSINHFISVHLTWKIILILHWNISYIYIK